ncbi:MAG TPA: universal stress protein [Gemmatimonadaceae bacterium]|nr:universal stress protein [Gemmatimonadaceae bacterium]
MERILVGVDFSPESEVAARTAITFARAFDAAVTLLHVHELPTMLNAIVPGADNRADRASLHDAAALQLASFRRRLQARDPRTIEGGIAVELIVDGGVPAEAILKRARDEEFDLIVVGTHNLTGLQRLLVGSVAEAVVRAAPCPVVTVHLPLRELR